MNQARPTTASMHDRGVKSADREAQDHNASRIYHVLYTLTVVSNLEITDRGLIDADRFELVQLAASG